MIDFSLQRFLLIRLCLLTVLVAFLLQGCSSQSEATWKTVQLGMSDIASQIEKSPLQNNLTYLRANINGLDVLLVKGYLDQDSRGPIDVWYSSDGSVMRIQQGRYLGSVGFDQNWQEVSRKDAPNLMLLLNAEMTLPSNNSITSIKTVKKYFSTQSYVGMPSYLVMRDERVSAVVSDQSFTSIPNSIPSSFKKNLQNKGLIWVSETPQPNSIFQKKGTSFAWYGFLKNKVGFEQVIGQQCLSKEFCITWMPWPIQP
jgi:hypothetical protein